MEDIEVMRQNLEKLQKENASLKSQIQLLKEKENSYLSSISRMKKFKMNKNLHIPNQLIIIKTMKKKLKKIFRISKNIRKTK